MNERISVFIFTDQNNLQALSDGLSAERGLEIIGSAFQTYEAKKALDSHKNVVTVVDYTKDNAAESIGLIKYLSESGLLSICLCMNASEGFELLKHGGTEMFLRPLMTSADDQRQFFMRLVSRVKMIEKKYYQDSSRKLKYTETTTYRRIVAIGSSTGGTETIFKILRDMPKNAPPIVIVQHMPPVFTKMYAERMNTSCKISVWEAKDGDMLRPGLALIAPGDFHMTLAKKNNEYIVECMPGPKVHGQCPSVDMLFNSVAKSAGKDAIGVILTGMGADGASGLLAMKKTGAYTIGQNEESCVVYGMPKAAYEIGAVTKQLPLEKIAEDILENI